MYQAGLHHQACALFAHSWLHDQGVNWNPLMNQLQHLLPNWRMTEKKDQSIEMDLVNRTSNKQMIVLLLEDNYGGTSRTIAVTENCIFDSNEKTSLPIQNDQSTLHRCVSTMLYQCKVVKYPKVIFLNKVSTVSFLIQQIFFLLQKHLTCLTNKKRIMQSLNTSSIHCHC